MAAHIRRTASSRIAGEVTKLSRTKPSPPVPYSGPGSSDTRPGARRLRRYRRVDDVVRLRSVHRHDVHDWAEVHRLHRVEGVG